MSYTIDKMVQGKSFDEVIAHVTEKLKEEGFGIITEINVNKTLKEKLDVDFRKYRILGACNPEFAYRALCLEDKIGAMLPCNIIVQERDNGEIEISAIDPISSMIAVENEDLMSISIEVQEKLQNVIKNI